MPIRLREAEQSYFQFIERELDRWLFFQSTGRASGLKHGSPLPARHVWHLFAGRRIGVPVRCPIGFGRKQVSLPMSTKRSKALPIMLLIFPLLLSVLFPVPVRADVGPKPQLTIIVRNPPDLEYYLDLLVPEPNDPFRNLNDRSGYDQTKLALLENYRVDGWTPALVRGTRRPLSGSLVGEKAGSTMRHTFGYVGLPEEFRLILVTSEAELVVSKTVRRNTFQETVIYDHSTGEIRQQGMLIAYLRQFLTTCIPTLLIEGAALLLFGYSLRHNWRSLLAVNVATQVFLTAAFGSALLRHGAFSAFLLFIPAEVAILLGETLVYSFLLREHGRRRAIWYAIVANLSSAVIGAILQMKL